MYRRGVLITGTQSTLQSLLCGVPQGSVLRPLLFILYSADVISIAASHVVCRYCIKWLSPTVSVALVQPTFNLVCLPVADVTGRSHLRSAEHHDMLVTRNRTQFGQHSVHIASLLI